MVSLWGTLMVFHRSHSEFLKFMVEDCKKLGLKPIIVTFKPHPRLVLDDSKPFLITDYNEKNKFSQKTI